MRWVWLKGRGYTDQNGRVVLVSGVIMDIDERKPAGERYRLQATALQEAANAVVLTDHKGTNLYVNPAFEQMTGYRAKEVFGDNPKILRSGKHDSAFYKAMWSTIAAGDVWRGEIVNRKKDGSLYTEEMMVAPVRWRTATSAISLPSSRTSPNGSRPSRRCKPPNAAIAASLKMLYSAFFRSALRDGSSA